MKYDVRLLIKLCTCDNRCPICVSIDYICRYQAGTYCYMIWLLLCMYGRAFQWNWQPNTMMPFGKLSVVIGSAES